MDKPQPTMLVNQINAILDRHRPAIMAHITSKSGGLTQSVLKNDEAARELAGFCYDFLPWPMRLAIKKPAFADFVVTHREAVLTRLVNG